MRDEHRGEADSRVPAGLYDIVFALNLASSFAYALLVCVIKRLTHEPPDDLCHFFLRGAARINRVLGVAPAPVVSTATVERYFPPTGEQLGKELVVLVSVLAAIAIVYLLLKTIAGTRLHRALITRLLGPSLLFAAPLTYLFLMRDASGPPYYGVDSLWGVSFWWMVVVLGAEVLTAIVVSLGQRLRRVPGWLPGTLWLLHIGFWFPVLWRPLPPAGDFGAYFGFFVPHALLIGWFLLAVIWTLRLRRAEPTIREAGTHGTRWTPVVGAAAAAVCAFVFVWLPYPVRSVAHPRDLDSVRIELSRGPCLGLCPSYSVRVHGNGSVEYAGEEDVKERARATTLSSEQVAGILQKLESVGFFGLEDSAFAWCFDTPGIAVLASVDGATHRVSSDASCTGTRSGTQARFVQVANEIDQIIGSRRRVE